MKQVTLKTLKEGSVLIDGKVRHAEHPTTFEIPSEDQTKELGPEWCVKIGIEQPQDVIGGDERVWVEIVERKDNGFVGRMDSTPFFSDLHGIKHDDHLHFNAENILATALPRKLEIFANKFRDKAKTAVFTPEELEEAKHIKATSDGFFSTSSDEEVARMLVALRELGGVPDVGKAHNR